MSLYDLTEEEHVSEDLSQLRALTQGAFRDQPDFLLRHNATCRLRGRAHAKFLDGALRGQCAPYVLNFLKSCASAERFAELLRNAFTALQPGASFEASEATKFHWKRSAPV